MAPPLIGRDEARAALDAVVSEVTAGAFRTALVCGAAGLGKTRLVAEVVAGTAAATTSLTARCYRWGGASSFGPWAEAIDRHLRRRAPADVRSLCTGPAAALAPFVGAIGRVVDAPATSPDRGRLLEALVDLLDRLSSQEPVIVAIDDVHLADASSWEALRYLGRRLDGSPIGILATARPGELTHLPVAAEVLVGLEEDDLLRRVELEPLTGPQLTDLAHQVLRLEGSGSSFVPAPLVVWLQERSLGHPLFAIGLLRALIREGADLAAPRLERLPAGLRDRVGLDLADLSRVDRDLLEVLAVADQRLDVGQLRELSERPVPRIEASLDALTTIGLVAEPAGGADPTYELSHPIVQDAVYESIGTDRRRRLHRAIARDLAAAGRLGAAAGHFARAAVSGDDEVIDALCRAMVEAEERGLHEEALAVLAALVDVLPDGDPRWRRVLDAMGWQAEWVLSHLAESDAATAILAMERIRSVIDPTDEPVAAAIVEFHLAAFLSFGAGRLEEAEVAGRAAVAGFRVAGTAEEALLARNELAWIRGSAGDLVAQATIASEVLADAEAGEHLRAAVQAACTAAYATGYLGRVTEADRLFARAVDLATEEGNAYRVAWAHAQQGATLGLVGRLDEATDLVDRALTVDARAPDAVALENLAQCRWLRGRLHEALDCLERSAVRRRVSGSRRRAWGAALAARLHAELGRTGRAEAALGPATSTYGGTGFLVWGFWAPWTEALLRWHAGHLGAAVEGFEAVAHALSDLGAVGYEALVLADLAECAREAADVDASARAATRAAALAATAEGPLVPALADLCAAQARLTEGTPDRAADAADRAGAALADLGYALLVTSARQAQATALGERDRRAATALLQRAAEDLDERGAVWRRDRALAQLHRLGSRGRRAAATVQGPPALTPREREVSELAARGFTAREIGARLFIGRRTVESHLAASYAKLGVASKRELVRRAEELGLDGAEDPYAAP